MRFLVVNFHYIQEENKYPYPGIYSTSVERLENQIKKLGEFFNFVGQKEILEAIKEKKSLPKRSCLLTFDDGLSSQYENAFFLLKKFKIPGIFFVSALPYAEGKACLVHKIHYSRANLPPEVFLNKVLDFAGKEIDFPDFQELKKRYSYSDQEEARIRYILDEYLTNAERKTIIEKIFQEIVGDEKAWSQEYYISKEGLSDLASHFFLGIHSYSHSRLIGRSFEDLKKDLKKTLSIINKIAGYPLEAISYPYGTENLLKAAKATKSLDLKIGFTLERCFNKTLQSPFLLARIDTNDAPGGKFPLFSFKGEELILKQPFREKRALET